MSSDRQKEKAIAAMWSVELNCHCPHCKEYVDLLKDGEFWDGRHFEIGEHGTDRTKNVEVWCPKCGKSFVVDLER